MSRTDNVEVSAREATLTIHALMSRPEWERKLSKDEIETVQAWMDWLAEGRPAFITSADLWARIVWLAKRT